MSVYEGRTSRNRGFWGRLLTPFRRSRNRLSNCDEAHSDDGNFRFQDRPRFGESINYSKWDSHIPKSLGDINAATILFGGSSPENFSQDSWLEDHLNRFGDIDPDDFNTQDRFFVHTEAHSGFGFRTNLNHHHHEALSSYDDSIYDEFDRPLEDSTRFSDFDENSIDIVYRDYGNCNDDDSTLHGSTSSRESTVSEVLGMLDNTLMHHSQETSFQMPSLPSYPSPPPYSTLNNTNFTQLTQNNLTPLEPPPAYSDIFGPETNSERIDFLF